MASIKRFEELDCWKTARELVAFIYARARVDEMSKDYGFRNQICRAAISIMSNIAEGFESQSQAKFIDYLGHAKASAGEVRSDLYVANDLGYISKQEFVQALSLVETSSKQIHGLMKYLKSLPNSYRVSENGSTYLVDQPLTDFEP